MRKLAKQEFVKMLDRLPAEARALLLSKQAQIIDHRIYVVKSVAELTNKEMFASADTKVVGTTNLNAGKTDVDEHVVCIGMRLTTGTGPSIGVTEFESVHIDEGIANGEVESFECGKETFLSEMPISAFDNQQDAGVAEGEFYFSAPKYIPPQKELKLRVVFAAAASADTWLKVELICAKMIKK